MDVTFKEITEENFSEYEPHFMAAEDFFPEEIRSDSEDFRFMLEKQFDPVAVAMYVDGEFAGFAIGSSIDDDEVNDYGFPLDLSGKKIIYFFDITLIPKFQGNGVGKRLFNEFIVSAKYKNYDYILGHYRPGGSVSLIKKLGGVEVAVEKNWESTGEDYAACVLPLMAFSRESLLQTHRSEITGDATTATTEAVNTAAAGTHSA